MTSLGVQGVTDAPRLIRACLDISDSTVTIDYSSFSDLCGSFKEHHIYGSETGSNYRLLATEVLFATNSTKVKLPNSNGTWSFFFETRYQCNGSDTAKSNIISIDDQRPDDISIDSISIDYLTQKPVIGWSSNTSKDTKGYRLYTVSNSINTTIGDTNGLLYFVENESINPYSSFTLAAFDSCNLFSRISTYHKAIKLQTEIDTCTKTAQLTWSPYEGWETTSQAVHYSTNNSTYLKIPVLKNELSFSLPNVSIGDSVCFFIRSTNAIGATVKTSSSNVSCVKLNQPIYPKTTYLSNVTVLSKDQIKIESFVENYGVADSLVLYHKSGVDTKIGSAKLKPGAHFYEWTDNVVNTNEETKIYFVRCFAPCLGGISSSLNSNSILLQINDDVLTWNDYNNWSGGLEQYDVLGFNGSTWNTLGSTQEKNFINTDSNVQCFRVNAIEVDNKFGFSRVSTSNEVCAERSPKFFVPNAINPLSHNHTFRVIGPSIDVTKSTMIIFNRWGEQIFITNNIKEGWTVATDKVFVPLGVYFYDIAIFDLSGNRHRLTGGVRVIR